MARKPAKKLTSSWLRKIGVPAVLIPGMIVAAALGWTGWQKLSPKYSHTFPESGVVQSVTDGDTFELLNSTVRLVGVNAATRDEESTSALKTLVENKKVWLEYDRYQNDKYGRILAWVWVNCEGTPTFLPSNYMHLSKNESRPGLNTNPPGCLNGDLVQEELLKNKLVEIEIFKDRGELKYESRLQKIND